MMLPNKTSRDLVFPTFPNILVVCNTWPTYVGCELLGLHLVATGFVM